MSQSLSPTLRRPALSLRRCLTLGAALALGACSSSGSGGPPDLAPEGPVNLAPVLYPSVSGVQPSSVFLARTTDVTISGYDTRWTAATQVDFSAGITVNSINVASPAALVANITVSDTAAIGKRDVTVTEGTTGETYKMAFQVESPIEITLEGSKAQGSILVAHILNHDFLNPFDTTSMGDGLFTPITFPHIDVSSSLPGTQVSVSNVQPFAIDATVTVDVLTTPGKSDLLVASGPAGALVNFPAPASLQIAARTPAPLLTTKSTDGTIAKAFESASTMYTPSENINLVQIDLSTSSAGTTPELILLPKSGAFADAVTVANAGNSIFLLTRSADPYYGIVWESSGASNYPWSITTTSTAITNSGMEKEPNDTAALAKTNGAIEPPYAVLDASLSSATDQDWFAITVSAANVMKSLRVITAPGDPKTDTVVDVFDADGTTSLGGPSDDTTYHENFLSAPIPKAGTIYVQISASSVFVPAHKDYSALIRFE